jgi:hypothetical protein
VRAAQRCDTLPRRQATLPSDGRPGRGRIYRRAEPAHLRLTALVSWGDLLTGVEVSFTPLYFIPIALAAWYQGKLLATSSRGSRPPPGCMRSALTEERAGRLEAQKDLEHCAAMPEQVLVTGLLSREGSLELAERELAPARGQGSPPRPTGSGSGFE